MSFDGGPGNTSIISANNAEDGDSQVEPHNLCIQEDVSSSGERTRENGSAGEVLTKVDLDLIYSSEKLLNLDILLMDVASRASDYEALAVENENISDECAEKALEFDVLSGILDSEVKELDDFMITLQWEIVDAREQISSCEYQNEGFLDLEEKLHDSEESLKKSQNQVAEMRMHSSKFQNNLALAFGGQASWNRGPADISESNELAFLNAKVKTQTAEQQRHILRMLEKSLARELDLEKRLCESRHDEEELELKVHYAEQEIDGMEDITEIILERLFEAENAAEVLKGISKELMGKLQLVQFNLNNAVQRESEMRSKLHTEDATLRDKVNFLEEKLKESDIQLQHAIASAEGSREQKNMLYAEIDDLENVIEDMKANLMSAESKAESAEGKCKLLSETNLELNEELGLLKSSNLEKLKQLKQSDTQLQHAKASIEASQEQQSMLYSALSDMENLIEDLKAKVLKAESRAESAEAKCAVLTETNSELNEELSFLRGRIECLEASLHQADEAKEATAKDIGIRTKVITDLVMRLGKERERLQIQISSQAKENSILRQKNGKTSSTASIMSQSGNENETGSVPTNGATTAQCPRSSDEASATGSHVDKYAENVTVGETEVESTVSADDNIVVESKLETVRRIEAGQLGWKYVVLAILILLISMFVVYLFQLEGCPF